MNPYWSMILAGTITTLLGMLANIWLFRWMRRQHEPDELHEEINQMGKDLVAVRERIKYIEGRINGKHWARD